jgi:recombination protein RecT
LEQQVNALATIQHDVYSVRERFDSIAANSVNFEREAGFAIQLLTASDYAMKIATENRQSVINAVTNIAAIGISLNPAKKQAYLVPRDGKICLDISYMGLLDIAIQSGSIMWGQAELVHQADRFELHGFDKPPTHARDPFSTERGPLVGVYVVVKTRDGDYLTTTMTIDEVFDIRNRSSAWKAWESKQKRCPWVTDEGEMVKKTVIKRAYKLWPKTDRLDTAVHFLNTEGGEGLAELSQGEGDTSRAKSHRASGTDGMLAALPIEEQNAMRDLAMDVIGAFKDGEPAAFDAYTACQLNDKPLENDHKVALWSLLPSNVRSAIKREGVSRDASKAAA